MKPVQVSGQVDNQGLLHLEGLPPLPAGEKVRVLIMEATDIAALERLIEIAADMADIDPALLAQLDALDEALWDAQFAASTDVLKTLAEQARQAYEQDQTEDLDFDELNMTTRQPAQS